jgi:hypothetical protein
MFNNSGIPCSIYHLKFPQMEKLRNKVSVRVCCYVSGSLGAVRARAC